MSSFEMVHVGSRRRRRTVTRRELVPVRKGVANLPLIYQAGKAANERYLDALTAAATHGKAVGALDRLCRPRVVRGRRHAGFSPLSEKDLAIFRAVLAGEHVLHGFSNHDLTRRLHHDPPADPAQARRRCAATSRLIAKMRGHGLLAKIPNRRRYRFTDHGVNMLSAVLAVHDEDIPHAYTLAA